MIGRLSFTRCWRRRVRHPKFCQQFATERHPAFLIGMMWTTDSWQTPSKRNHFEALLYKELRVVEFAAKKVRVIESTSSDCHPGILNMAHVKSIPMDFRLDQCRRKVSLPNDG